MSTPQIAQGGAVDISTAGQAGGNMEGKETRFGIATSGTWAAFTTAALNGSVNSMHDSYTPLGGMIPMLLMMLGEVVYGGVGRGLYGMLAFAILTVFIAGLMVGRTPEYLGKKIEPYEMKMAVLICLATPIGILVGSGIAPVLPATADSLNNPGAHGLSEVLYIRLCRRQQRVGVCRGFNANTPFLNTSIGLVMLFCTVPADVRSTGHCGQYGAEKEGCSQRGNAADPQCNVYLLTDCGGFADRCAEFLPGTGAGTNCRVL